MSEQPSQVAADLAAQMMGLFYSKTTAGARRYGNDEIRHFLPLFLYFFWDHSHGLQLPVFGAKVFVEFAEHAGIGQGDPPAAIQQAIERYYGEHPVNPDLLAGIRRLVHEHEAEGRSEPSDHTRFKSFLGDTQGTEFPRSSPPPAGVIAAGPAARFALSKGPIKTD